MRRLSHVVLAIAATAALTLTACSGGIDRQTLTDELVNELEASGDYTEEQITCIVDGLQAFTDTELEDLDSGEPSEAVSTKLFDMLSDCLLPQ